MYGSYNPLHTSCTEFLYLFQPCPWDHPDPPPPDIPSLLFSAFQVIDEVVDLFGFAAKCMRAQWREGQPAAGDKNDSGGAGGGLSGGLRPARPK